MKGHRKQAATAATTFLLALCASSAAAERYGVWEVTVERDAITDKPRAMALAGGENGSLLVKCDEPGPGSLYVRFLSNRYLGGFGNGRRFDPVIYRFDESAPVSGEWVYYKDFVTAVNPERRAIVIQGLKSAKRLTLRAVTFEYEKVDASFDLSGAAEAIAAVEASCGANG